MDTAPAERAKPGTKESEADAASRVLREMPMEIPKWNLHPFSGDRQIPMHWCPRGNCLAVMPLAQTCTGRRKIGYISVVEDRAGAHDITG
jgi:hypothetical protein